VQMKKSIQQLGFCILMVVAGSSMLRAQQSSISNNLAVGFQLTQIHRDFGFGLNFTSPYFIHDNLAVRVRGNMMFFEHIDEGEYTWTPYSNFTVGIIGYGATIANLIRLYGEGGIIGLLPSDKFSSESISIGGYGLFGFEFYFFERGNYFIEIGGSGTGGRADKIAANPIYSNGFTINVGFRFHL
ncbi:MAG: hypothetical protein ACPF9D_06450, partial [Owenweeksia sp.]